MHPWATAATACHVDTAETGQGQVRHVVRDQPRQVGNSGSTRQLVRSIMNRLTCNQCSLRTFHGNDAVPVDPTQMPGWQNGSLVAAGPPLLPPPVAQADRAEPIRMSAQTPIAAGTFIMGVGRATPAAIAVPQFKRRMLDCATFSVRTAA